MDRLTKLQQFKNQLDNLYPPHLYPDITEEESAIIEALFLERGISIKGFERNILMGIGDALLGAATPISEIAMDLFSCPIASDEYKKIINDAMKLSPKEILSCASTFIVWKIMALSKATEQDPMEVGANVLKMLEATVYQIIRDNYITKRAN